MPLSAGATPPLLQQSWTAIRSDERYPWALWQLRHGARPLATGDYPLVDGGNVLAVVERKTFEGLLADFGRMDILRQRLLELIAFEQHAVVIEAPYEDFLSPEKVHHWSVAFCARAIILVTRRTITTGTRPRHRAQLVPCRLGREQADVLQAFDASVQEVACADPRQLASGRSAGRLRWRHWLAVPPDRARCGDEFAPRFVRSGDVHPGSLLPVGARLYPPAGRALQVVDGHTLGAGFEGGSVGEREPVLDDAHAANGALIEQLPPVQEIRPFRELLLERHQHTQKILLVDWLVELVATEMNVVAATAELAIQVPQMEQVVRPRQDDEVRRLSAAQYSAYQRRTA